MTELTYEHPLNEKTRSYLRLEYIAEQLQYHVDNDHQHNCFYPLFTLCELAERTDYRGEVLQDLNRQIFALERTPQLANCSEQQIHSLVEQLKLARVALQNSERAGVKLKSNRFLSALRQRFNMPGACCNFDLPQLHYWLGKPWSVRQAEYEEWISEFMSLLSSIRLLLDIRRQASDYTLCEAPTGFHQGQSDKALSLIRVKIAADKGCYPTISGHRNRYAIHFVEFGLQKQSSQNIEFELATCS